MTDIISNDAGNRRPKPPQGAATPALQGLGVAPGLMSAKTREMLVECAELLFFAYRDFTGDADVALEEFGFGRAHHRVLHFVFRHPGLCVADLLDILRITKQSLARVLKQLVDEGYIAQRAGDQDRRERRLYVTVKGGRLAEKLTQLQVKRIAAALARVGRPGDDAVRQFLLAMISEVERPRVEKLLRDAEPKNRGAPKGRQK